MERVGFLGLGIMGSRMAANLRGAGHELTVYNRTRERAEAFAREHGATVADARAVADRVGARWLVEELDLLTRRARLPVPGALPAAPTDDGHDDELGLTPREREVLTLLAQGRTNREIGEALFMAEKTASVHVSRILAKLDVRTRTEAAAVAHRLGIAA